MTSLYRIRTAFTGFVGAPGVSTMYSLNPPTDLADLHALWTGLKGGMPSDVTISVLPAGDIIEDTTGALTGQWAGLQTADLHGGVAGGYSAPSGALLSWTTATILDGKRVRGRTFVVPCGNTMYDVDGSIETAILGQFRQICNAFVVAEAGSFVVWHRPRKARAATATLPARLARVGGHAVVTGSTVPDKVVVLRSRRD